MTSILEFPDRSRGFVPQRLIEARLAMMMSRAELARELGITGQAIGYYETGARRPDMDMLLRAAAVLEQPVSFFLRASPSIEDRRGTRFFRSVGTRSNKINYALDIRAKWLWELVSAIAKEVRQPDADLPDVPPPSNQRSYSIDELEEIATSLRRHWGLGDGPIANVVALFETHGLVVTRFELGSDQIDAFSCWINQKPHIFLGSDKKSCCRSRFDAAHELGHILLHRDIAQEDIENKRVRDRIEHEANLFAGAFLFPQSAMFLEFYSTRMNHFIGLKKRWRVSIQAIAHRAKNLDIIDEDQYILFRKNISFHRWNKSEPLDDEIPLEQPQWLLKCWELFVKRRGIQEMDTAEEIGFTLDLVVRLFGRTDISTGRPRERLSANC
jgi:Zn-dependent peptidase ImmA (M78 family)/transcriptional regulator with XRE-family HTH domain